eukprot:g539.t1
MGTERRHKNAKTGDAFKSICDNTFFQSSEEVTVKLVNLPSALVIWEPLTCNPSPPWTRALTKRLHSLISGIPPSPSVTTLTRFSPFQCQGNVFHSSSSSAVIFLAEFGTDDGNVDVTDLAGG